jgi:hypothetical protein
VMAGEDGPGQVVEVLLTRLALITLTLRLGRIVTLSGDRRGVAMGTDDALGPSQLADGLEALEVVDEVLDLDHRR